VGYKGPEWRTTIGRYLCHVCCERVEMVLLTDDVEFDEARPLRPIFQCPVCKRQYVRQPSPPKLL
jgi:hypothetical protein